VSPRHVPDRVLTIAEVPRTTSGKKAEVPLKRILQGGATGTNTSDSVKIDLMGVRALVHARVCPSPPVGEHCSTLACEAYV
jgi:hypothetical protein